MNLLSYRPGCAKRRTVFENQLLLYDELQRSQGHHFHHVVDEESLEADGRFEWTGLHRNEWQSFRGRHWFAGMNRKVTRTIELARNSDAILTVDPVVYPQALLAFEAGRRLDLPVSFAATITLLSETMNSRWYSQKYRVLLRLMDQASSILIPSPKVIERFAQLKLLTPAIIAKFHFVGHPIDINHFTPAPDRRVPGRFLCVTRLIPEKGVAYILEAFAAVAKVHPDATLQFLGDGMMAGWVSRRSASLGLKDRVAVTPPVAHKDLPLLLQAGDIFVTHPLSMPWWEEYFGVSALEAMACGLPVISTAGGGIPFALRLPARFRAVAERDITDLAVAMHDYLSLSQSDRNCLVKQNREFVSEVWQIRSVASSFPRLG